jgi:type II secretory pathway pseudopilin PulG
MSLVEVILALLIMGAVITAYMATLTTATNGSRQHRDFVSADRVLRDYAETIKSRAQNACTSAGATFSGAYTSPDSTITVNTLSTQTCPSVTGLLLVHLTATTTGGTTKALDVEVRTP